MLDDPAMDACGWLEADRDRSRRFGVGTDLDDRGEPMPGRDDDELIGPVRIGPGESQAIPGKLDAAQNPGG